METTERRRTNEKEEPEKLFFYFFRLFGVYVTCTLHSHNMYCKRYLIGSRKLYFRESDSLSSASFETLTWKERKAMLCCKFKSTFHLSNKTLRVCQCRKEQLLTCFSSRSHVKLKLQHCISATFVLFSLSCSAYLHVAFAGFVLSPRSPVLPFYMCSCSLRGVMLPLVYFASSCECYSHANKLHLLLSLSIQLVAPLFLLSSAVVAFSFINS